MSDPKPRYVSSEYLLTTGFAQLPKGTPLSEMQKVFACSLVIDKRDGKVVDASFTFLMGLTEEFLRGLVIGRSVPDDWDIISQEIRSRFLTPTQGAIIQAIQAAIDRYTEKMK